MWKFSGEFFLKRFIKFSYFFADNRDSSKNCCVKLINLNYLFKPEFLCKVRACFYKKWTSFLGLNWNFHIVFVDCEQCLKHWVKVSGTGCIHWFLKSNICITINNKSIFWILGFNLSNGMKAKKIIEIKGNFWTRFYCL